MATRKATTATKKASARKPAAARTTRTTVTSAPASATKNTFVGSIQASVRSLDFWRSLGAELIGTFLLASVIIAGQGQPIFVLFALVGIVLGVGAISGAHVNPAITIAAWATRRIGWLRALGYIVAQGVGAALAYFAFTAFIGATVSGEAALFSAPTLFEASPVSGLAGKEWYFFFGEVLGTAILGFAIANATREVQDRTAAAFTAGLGIFIALMVSITAASYIGATSAINPAVAIALQGYDWANLWSFGVYALAPIVGALVGFIVYDLIRGRQMVTK